MKLVAVYDDGDVIGGIPLTPTEDRVAGLVAKGYANQHIADELFIDIKTVSHHVNNIYSKVLTDMPPEERKLWHQRVWLTLNYLRAMGMLIEPTDDEAKEPAPPGPEAPPVELDPLLSHKVHVT